MNLVYRSVVNVAILWIFVNISKGDELETPHANLHFCYDNKLYVYSTKECPGGIRFIKNAIQTRDDCYCPSGAFLAIGSQFRRDYSVISGSRNKCLSFNGDNQLIRADKERCEEEDFSSRWAIVPLADYDSTDDIWMAVWHDPQRNGELKNFRRFPLNDFKHGSLFQHHTTFAGFVAIVKPKSSEILNFQLGNACFDLSNPEGQIFIFEEAYVIDHHANLSEPGSYQTPCISTEHLYKPRQIISDDIDSEVFCDITTNCEEHDDTYAKYPKDNSSEAVHSGLTEEERTKLINKENAQLVEFRMRMEHQGAKVVASTSHRLEIVNLTKRILQKGASDIIPQSLVETAYKLFHYLYFDVDTETDLQNSEYKQIIYSLEQCLYHMEPLSFIKSGCPVKLDGYNMITPAGVTLNYDESQIPQDRKFDQFKNDAIVEFMWKTVDFAHAKCFGHFGFHSNLHHYFENQIEKLFLMEAVQYRWNRDIPSGMKLYGSIIPNLDLITMTNLDFLVGTAQLNNVYDYWLKKPSLDTNKAQEIAKTEQEEGENYNEYKIWGGLAYCLQLVPMPIDGKGVAPGKRNIPGLQPRLYDISQKLSNGPERCLEQI